MNVTALATPPDAEVVRRAADAVQAVTGRPARLIGARYATEAADLTAAGIPAVVLGPGDPAQAHAADESVPLDQVQSAAEVFHHLMTQSE